MEQEMEITDGQEETGWVDETIDDCSNDRTGTGRMVPGSIPGTHRGRHGPADDIDSDRSTHHLRELYTDVSLEPVYADGRLYAVSDGSLVSLEADGSGPAWTFSTSEVPASSPVVYRDFVYWRTEETLHAVHRKHGGECWSAPKSASIQGPPGATDELVVTAARSGAVSIVTAEYGRDVRSFRPPHRPSSATLADGDLYVTSLEGGIAAYDAIAGTERWRFAPNCAMFAPPVVDSDTVYVSTVDDGSVCALDRETGGRRWSHRVGASVWTRPLVSADTVFVAGDAGTLVAIRTADGVELWTTVVPERITSEPVLEGDTLYIGCTDGMYALHPETGAIRSRFELRGDVAVVPGSDSVFVRDERGSLFVASV